ncbi:glycosyl hydrolase family 18 protein [Thermomonospora cellulosilytica]|uniref:chitinase n=1 Tax=Thermomonospora cellulosilytica TaxID=1411118 RepID=A0A7W3N2A8_9ACTN|nr:glycosyl hydrolase family 18 protein [Thermomonospora cellulosilytica]MBA9006261.1 chitinase [Thermomonospora cellulosilytica]
MFPQLSGRRATVGAVALLLSTAGVVVPMTSATAAAAVTASCTKTSDWGTGFEGRCTVTNGTAATVNGWKVEFDLPAGTSITSSWDATRSSSGGHYTFTNAGWNGTLAAGASASFGFGGTGGGWISNCLVNGAACDGSGGGPGGDEQAPTAPTGLRSTGRTSTTVSLAWTASTDNVGVTGYDVYRGSTKEATVTGTEATVTGLSPSTSYTFTVRARDAAGNTSPASGAVTVTTESGGTGGPGGKKVIGYFAQWGVYQRNYHVKNIDTSGSAAKLTHINYAFGNVQNGQCTIGDSYADYDRFYSAAESVDGVADSWDAGALRGSFNQLRKLKKKYPHLKVLWSFGGWTWSSGFGQAAQNPAAFAESCYKLVEDPRWADVFDGIDIDWEYPNACGATCDNSGPAAFRNLMAALRQRFGSGNLVTAAITADASSGGKIDAADYGGAAQYVDWYLPMTYDFFGAWAATGPTAPHSPLTSYPGIPTQGFDSASAIAKLKAKGVPASKLLLGIGFYGRGWTGVTQSTPGGSATGPAPGTYEQGIEDYKVLKTRCPATGTVAGTAYAHCGNQWWSYDTPATIGGKMSYANDQGLAGAFFWELSGDTAGGEQITAIRNGLG